MERIHPEQLKLPFPTIEQVLVGCSCEELDHIKEEAAKTKQDFYGLVASRALGMPLEQVHWTTRDRCKLVLFAYLYGTPLKKFEDHYAGPDEIKRDVERIFKIYYNEDGEFYTPSAPGRRGGRGRE